MQKGHLVNGRESDLLLLCRVQSRLYALPLAHVIETMRPLPIEATGGRDGFILGLSIIRGAPVPVINVASLSDMRAFHPKRFVTMTTGTRHIALAVDDVIGVRLISQASLQSLPPLLQDLASDIILAIGTLDNELLFVLRNSHFVPEEFWEEIEGLGVTQ